MILHRIDAIPLSASEGVGQLFVTNFSAVGPEPQAALDRVGASHLVCMLTEREIEMRYPEYAQWLVSRQTTAGEHATRAHWLPTPDGSIVGDEPVVSLVSEVVTALCSGDSVLVHCGAGMARTAVVGILTMIAFGADPSAAPRDFRTARPGGGPDGPPQQQQIDRLTARARTLRYSG